jgi:uncharacterized protein YbaR (Trm112 family)
MTSTPSTAHVIDPWLREILRCPACRSELRDAGTVEAPELACTDTNQDTTGASCGLVYRIDDGIPVLLVDEARKP